MRAAIAAAILAYMTLAPVVLAVQSVREARVRSAVRGHSAVRGGAASPQSLATSMGNGAAAKTVPLSSSQSLHDAVLAVTGFSLPASLAVSDACDPSGVAAKVPGDDSGARWVFALPGSVAGCTVQNFLTSAATGVPANAASAGGACARTRSVARGARGERAILGRRRHALTPPPPLFFLQPSSSSSSLMAPAR